MIAIIGLGNPGKEYENTRHNVAWILLDLLVSRDSWQKNKYAKASLASMRIGEEDILLVKPDTFMNRSGEVLPYITKEYGVSVDTLLVIQDDIDIPLGKIRISYDRGDGGHNGIKSITEILGSKEFLRFRIGVSMMKDEVLIKPDVLGQFSKEERETLESVGKTFMKALTSYVFDGKEKAMSLYNGK